MRVLIIAAHPDDETVGASAVLGCRDDVCVVHVTNGAPRDSRWWPPGITDRDAYARERDREAHRALSIVGIERIALGFTDQEAVFALRELIDALSVIIGRVEPELIVTHAYEGGHPDHDAVAAAVASCRTDVAAAVVEMSGYHSASGALCVGRFHGGPGRELALDSAQRQRRLAMLAAYRSQAATLQPFFAVGHECYRAAPGYDFSQPPHPGELHYERLGMASSAAWRDAVAECDGYRRAGMRSMSGVTTPPCFLVGERAG